MAFLFDFSLIDSNHCEISPYSITLLNTNKKWYLVVNFKSFTYQYFTNKN